MATGPVILKILDKNEELTNDDLNTIFSTLAAKFGSIQGSEFMYPFVPDGDFDLGGNSLVNAREIFDIIDVSQLGSDDSAWDQAVSELSSGGMILIPRDTEMLMPRGLKIRKNRNRIYVLGQGYTSQIKMANDSDDHAITVDGCFRFRLSNFRINGNRENNLSGHGIWVNEGEDFEISNVWIGSGSTTGMAGSGIFVTKSKHFAIKRSWIRNPKRHGVHIENRCEDFTISQVLVSQLNNPNDSNGNQTGGDGIRVSNECVDGTIDCNKIYDIASQGIVVQTSSNIHVEDNRVRRVGGYAITPEMSGILVSGDRESDRAEGVSIMGNVSTENPVGITVGAHVTGKVLGNYVRGNTTAPLKDTSGNTSAVTFRDNVCMEKAHHRVETMSAGASFLDIDVGVSNLPIQAILATWRYDGDTSDLQDSVLGARYHGQTVTIYTANTLTGAADVNVSIEV